MPKPTKLHTKGKPTAMQKSITTQNAAEITNDTDSENAVRQFELELCWCIQQLERSLCDKKGSEKEIQETWKVLQVLKNNNQPMIRKRQLMRSYFGDYRAKMQTEEKKLAKMASKMKITEKPEAKATFVRKSIFQTTGDSSFRFNFDLAKDQIESREKVNETANFTDTTISNTDCSNLETDKNITQDKQSHSQSDKNFKFTFSKSDFKFNFSVDT